MFSWFVTVLVAALVTFKVVAIAILLLTGIVIWALLRGLFRAADVVSARTFSRHRRAHVPAPPRPLCRYDAVRPIPQNLTPLPLPTQAIYSHRPKSSSWIGWALVGVIVAVAVVGMRSRGRRSVDDRVRPPTAERSRTIQLAEKTKQRNSKRSSPPVPAVIEEPVPVVEKTPPEPNPSWQVVGVGVTLEEAKDKACQKAWEELVDYLSTQTPPIEWTPSKEFVRKQLARKWGDEKSTPDEQLGNVIQISLLLELTPKDRERIAQHDHHFRVEQRMTWLGKVFAGIVVLLAAVAGYVRLDEWSKGYYTGLLRFAATAFVLATAAGFWFFTQR